MRPCLFIKILTRKPQVHLRAVAAALQRLPEALAQGLPRWLSCRIAGHLRGAQVVAVQVVVGGAAGVRAAGMGMVCLP